MASYKRLIVCCDGTWNQPFQEEGPTNIAKTVRAICPADERDVPQVVYYDPGVGTGNFVDRLIGGGLGVGLSQNVQDAYLFIVSNYQPEDQIFLFGFSRGAYTVRSLAGLIGAVGILRKRDLARFPEAYKYYRTPHVNRSAELEQKLLPPRDKRKEASIDFLGIWDTVGALGIPFGPLRFFQRWRYSFHDVELGRKVRKAFHALAIDERRRSFAPSVWADVPDPANQHVEQVWFAGAHSNVGGGYPNSGLSDVAWKWMMEKASECGLFLDQDYVRDVTVPNPPSQLYDSRAGWKWKFRRPLIREILATHPPTERIHRSVRDYLGASDGPLVQPSPYAPANIETLKVRLKAMGKDLDAYFV